MSYETIAVEHDGPDARVWLDRPACLNALDSTMLEEIADAFSSLQTSFDTRVVVLGGRGRAFSAGADRKDPPGRPDRGPDAGPRARRWASQLGRRAAESIERLEAVTIARLHGHVIGGGLVLALACDLRVAADDTRFHVPEVDLGIPLTWGAVPRLARAVGTARAKELILLAEPFGADDAARWGLVNRVVPADALDATTNEWVRRIADKPPWAVHMTTTQFHTLDRSLPLGDVTEGDGDLLIAASREDPARFAFPGPRR